MIKPPNKSN